MSEKKDDKKVNEPAKPAGATPTKKEVPLDKKVLDKNGRDFGRPKFFKKDGDV